MTDLKADEAAAESGQSIGAVSADTGTADTGTADTGTADVVSAAPVPPRCHWCRRVLPPQKGPGRRRKYCRQACRQWDWVSRQRAAELRLSEDELVMARSELDRLHDDLYVLACAVEDTERDLKGPLTKADLEDVLQWLLDAARPLRNRELAAPARRPT